MTLATVPNHETILNNDEYFCGIIEPLMDLSYQFSDNEMEKLPLQLQYYDRTRISDFSLINKLLDIIYKLISTGTGLDCLSRKGIYAVLRELDKSLNHLSQKNILFNEGNFKEYGSKDDWQEERIGNEICKRTVQNENKMKLIDENSDLLHLLIGILINSSENIK
ncbi:unnamed protein product [Dracunculus medinensis]|uniref:DUF384 domain-containing protein n=1 Tax=Dracunculus medinensis TaxID=318479 RepID=A0A158Q5T3_DRAME|nr:unnamed protein product [Dracunculus medinensis]